MFYLDKVKNPRSNTVMEVVYDEAGVPLILKPKLGAETDLSRHTYHHTLDNLAFIMPATDYLPSIRRFFYKLTNGYFFKIPTALHFDKDYIEGSIVVNLTANQYQAFKDLCLANIDNNASLSDANKPKTFVKTTLTAKDRVVVLKERRKVAANEYRNLAMVTGFIGILSVLNAYFASQEVDMGADFSYAQMSGIYTLVSATLVLFSVLFLTYFILFSRAHISKFLKKSELTSGL